MLGAFGRGPYSGCAAGSRKYRRIVFRSKPVILLIA
jgi:hypothetical protein